MDGTVVAGLTGISRHYATYDIEKMRCFVEVEAMPSPNNVAREEEEEGEEFLYTIAIQYSTVQYSTVQSVVRRIVEQGRDDYQCFNDLKGVIASQGIIIMVMVIMV